MESHDEKQIFTIGHSNRSFEEFLKILKHYDTEILIDVRRFPRSRRNPHFNGELLEGKLKESNIQYFWIESLGGFRGGDYEEYSKTKDFEEGLTALMEIAEKKRAAVMCAEILWFRCHRSFIASALDKRKWRVIHIYDESRADIHKVLIR
ncbi:MAG TPA: DUF488 domain-containing protein [Thermodesulfobacteriota bacterium]|nr:DUF488 domain-containing protein [Thermodesulfobacteriota bacterium]